MVRYLIPLFVFICLIILFLFGLQYDPSRVPSPLIDKPVPQFNLPQLGAPDLSLGSSDLLGKVTLMNVWASWCVACRHEHPLLVELSNNGVVDIYGLNYKDQRQDALAWLGQYGDPYLMSAFDESGRVGIDLGVYGVPETYIVDQKGIIRYKHIGAITAEDLQVKILPLIKELNQASNSSG